MTLSFESHNDPDINAVLAWFEFQIALIGESRASVLRSANLANNLMGLLRPHEAQFLGLTRREVEEFFDAQRGRLELLTMFELLATAEAILRVEFNARVTARKKDRLSRRFRELQKTRGERIRLDEDILVAMRAEGGVPANVIADFRGTLKLRHWLAHGKHWHPKLGRQYGPSDVFDIARNLIDSIPAS